MKVAKGAKKERNEERFSGPEQGKKERGERISENISGLFFVLAGFFILILIFARDVTKSLEDFLFWYITPTAEFINPPQLYLAELSVKPYRLRQVESLEIEARAAIAAELQGSGKIRILFAQKSQESLPIASLSKLVTASIIEENYNLEEAILIPARAATIEGDTNLFQPGQEFVSRDLLYSLLMESSNKAASALIEKVGEEKFVERMNELARNWALADTYFFNSTGLDPDEIEAQANFSTAEDLVKLVRHLLNQPLLWEILGTKTFKLYQLDGSFHHRIENTNELLENMPLLIGGKTGWTPRAGECLLVVLKNPQNESYLVGVILGSSDRFREMSKMIDWVYRAYKW